MRSHRAYQGALPTDRILAVLKANDSAHFDSHLVRRFSQLLGIYPPGNLVQLSSGEIGVVIRIHAPDPFRPRVRVIVDQHGARTSAPRDRNLWEALDESGEPVTVLKPVDPDRYGIDPLTFLA
jgi:hypothetical protein